MYIDTTNMKSIIISGHNRSWQNLGISIGEIYQRIQYSWHTHIAKLTYILYVHRTMLVGWPCILDHAFMPLARRRKRGKNPFRQRSAQTVPRGGRISPTFLTPSLHMYVALGETVKLLLWILSPRPLLAHGHRLVPSNRCCPCARKKKGQGRQR